MQTGVGRHYDRIESTGNPCFGQGAPSLCVSGQNGSVFCVIIAHHFINSVDGFFISVKPSFLINIRNLVFIPFIIFIVIVTIPDFIAIIFIFIVVVDGVGVVVSVFLIILVLIKSVSSLYRVWSLFEWFLCCCFA